MHHPFHRAAGVRVGLAALLLTACSEPDSLPLEPAAPAAAAVASCSAKKTLAERLDFASREHAARLLAQPDEWARQLSAFDRGARLRTLEPTRMHEFLQFAGAAALEWSAPEQAYWTSLAERLGASAAGLGVRLPHVTMVKTSGAEEFGSVYTRHRSIMLPQGRLAVAGDERRDFFLLAHELFHVLTREDPSLRDALYALLGFEPLRGFDYPAELEARRLSNPDAWSYQHAMAVQTPDGLLSVIPVVQTAIPLEELIALPSGPGPPPIFGVLQIVLVGVDPLTGGALRDDSGSLLAYHFGNTDWVPRMLRNSSYIIHPEELLADNFATLMEWRAAGVLPAANPGGFAVNDVALLQSMEAVLTDRCAANRP